MLESLKKDFHKKCGIDLNMNLYIIVKGSTKKKLKIMLRFLELYVCKACYNTSDYCM